MTHKKLPLTSLLVNPANDRHGVLENETAAISQLFAKQDLHMRNLTKDIVGKGEVFEPPLVYPDNDKFIIADGNRRTTCLKLLSIPKRAPTVELQAFFAEQRSKWSGTFPTKIECRVETDRDRVDDILFRRHTGVQGGIDQSNWNDRMQTNFVIRTGKSSGINLADEIEKRLKVAALLPSKKIPRSNLNRLLSAEALRNRVGISVRKGKLELIRDEQPTLNTLSRIASDLASQVITLDDIWDAEAKLKYIDQLDAEGILPSLSKLSSGAGPIPPTPGPPKLGAPKPTIWPHLIPDTSYEITWTARLQRHREIWEELQFQLHLISHPNAISVLFRVLLELSIDNYVNQTGLLSVHSNDKLSLKAGKVADDLQSKGKIDKKYLGVIKKLQQGEGIISIDTLNRYVHSPNFNVSPEHLKMIWNTLADFIVLCLEA